MEWQEIELIKADFVHKVSDSREVFFRVIETRNDRSAKDESRMISRACEGTDIIEDTFISNSRIGTVEFGIHAF